MLRGHMYPPPLLRAKLLLRKLLLIRPPSRALGFVGGPHGSRGGTSSDPQNV
jgi:hypothetical protein